MSHVDVIQESCQVCHFGCVKILPRQLEVQQSLIVGTRVRIKSVTSALYWGTIMTMGVPLGTALGVLMITNNFVATILGLFFGAAVGVAFYRRITSTTSPTISIEPI